MKEYSSDPTQQLCLLRQKKALSSVEYPNTLVPLSTQYEKNTHMAIVNTSRVKGSTRI